MHKFIRIFILCLLSNFGIAQDSIVIRGVVRERIDKNEIPNATITISYQDSMSFQVNTGYSGNFLANLPVSKEYNLFITHGVFEEKSISLNYNPKKDTIDVVIELNRQKIRNLDEVEILAPGVPDTVFSDSLLSVADFELLNDGNILLLVYPKRLDKGSELILWNNKEILNRLIVPEKAEYLVRDYRGNPHLICENKVFGIYIDGFRIQYSTLEKEYFEKYLSPVLDTNKTKYYLSNFDKNYPEFQYYAFDRMDSTYTKIVSITDTLMMELYRAEYKWADVRVKLWAKNKELETGIDAEIWVGATYFTKSIYYRELYAPMFQRNDSLFVFDYYRDQLMIFDENGKQLDSVSIYHHYHPKETGWKKNLIQDRVTGQIYAVMHLAGYTYIRRVNTETGKLEDKIQLEFRYVEKVEIHNNEVYYIYRPYESPLKKYLYRERLPHSFDKQNVPQGDIVERK